MENASERLSAEDIERFPGLAAYNYDYWSPLYYPLQAKFGKYEYYEVVFDPYYKLSDDPNHGQQGTATAADDIADLYHGLKRNLIIFDHGTTEAVRKACWHWRFEFDSHLSWHATGLLRALNWLVYDYLDDRDDEPEPVDSTAAD